MVNLIPGRMVDECPTEVPEGIQFPFGSLEEVEHFEEWLKEPRNSSQKKNLAASEAEDREGLSNDHTCFNDHRAASAVRKCHVAKQATDMDINKHVIRWFNLASDRGGGRRDWERRSAAQNQRLQDDL
ncbi:vegetative cell wall protein gp1-like protein [Lates japonicus]|uniref:Vegetative cell wall protein gp1-like protein n=1 Tax=Lates japonicus TaxID=270547 RepID=A0AAD3M6U4_LATJO|nr:vegetative cell wall protein gp1-like protein [Lates japonicus]